jgi:hypothetical protein
MTNMYPPIKRLSGVAAAVMLLSACSGNTQSQMAPSTGMSGGVTSNAVNAAKGVLSPFAFRGFQPAAKPNHKQSWMSPDAKNRGNALLYVSNLGTDDVTVYTYKQNGLNVALSGTLTGFTEPGVPCADKKGNVFVPDYGTAKVYEFAHGATTPTQVLTDPNGNPVSCSIDASTGNLAVANFAPTSGSGNVAVYPAASGTPTMLTGNNVAHPAFVGYTPKGDLYMDGIDSNSVFAMAVMPNGASGFSPVTVNGATLYSPGAIIWGGSFLLVGDQMYQNNPTSAVYQLCACGTNVKFQGVAPIQGSTDVIGFTKRGAGSTARIIAPDFGNPTNGVIIYNPSSQAISTNITDSVSQPVGAAISQKGK